MLFTFLKKKVLFLNNISLKALQNDPPPEGIQIYITILISLLRKKQHMKMRIFKNPPHIQYCAYLEQKNYFSIH